MHLGQHHSSNLCRVIGGVFLFLATFARADGWEAVSTQDLIARSRFIGVGRLTIDGKRPDGKLNGKITFSQQIYSAVGEVRDYPVAIAPVTIPGKAQNWPSMTTGVWFVLKDGDPYEPVNHPACRADEKQARAIADQAYQFAERAYEQAKAAAEKAGTSSGGGSSASSSKDSSDSAGSVAAYSAMVSAAESARAVPFQDKAKQGDRFVDHVNAILGTAGLKPPPAGGPLADLGKHDLARVQLELIRNTLASSNPLQSLQKMGPVPLGGDAAAPRGGDHGGPPALPGGPGAGGPKPGQFTLPQAALNQIPAGATRKQMLGSVMSAPTGPGAAPRGPAAPGPRPGPGPR